MKTWGSEDRKKRVDLKCVLEVEFTKIMVNCMGKEGWLVRKKCSVQLQEFHIRGWWVGNLWGTKMFVLNISYLSWLWNMKVENRNISLELRNVIWDRHCEMEDLNVCEILAEAVFTMKKRNMSSSYSCPSTVKMCPLGGMPTLTSELKKIPSQKNQRIKNNPS